MVNVLYNIFLIYFNQRKKEEKDEGEEVDGDADEEEEEDEDPQSGDMETDKNSRCPHVKLVQRVECKGVLPSCDITEEDAKRKWIFIISSVVFYTFNS